MWYNVFMTDELIIEHLRAIRADTAYIKNDIRDLKFRTGQIEQTLAQHSTLLAHHSARFDRIDERLSLIEGRHGLVDA